MLLDGCHGTANAVFVRYVREKEFSHHASDLVGIDIESDALSVAMRGRTPVYNRRLKDFEESVNHFLSPIHASIRLTE